MRFFKMDNSTERLFEVVIDDLDEVLSQAVDKHEREEAFSNDRLDKILSQSPDMFEDVNLKAKLFGIGGLQPISRDTDNNAAMYNCWWTNKRN